jgi:two-component system response regulator RegA
MPLPKPDDTAVGREGTILIVDDRQSSMDSAHRMLTCHGIRVAGAFTTSEAIVAARRVQPDLAVVSYRLGGDCGLDLVPLLRREAPEMLAILHSPQPCGAPMHLTAFTDGGTVLLDDVLDWTGLRSVLVRLRSGELQPPLFYDDAKPLRAHVRLCVRRMLRKTGGNVAEAAKRLGMDRRTVANIRDEKD